MADASSPEPACAESFERFPHLPAEIRLLIWRLACHPRDVEIVSGLKPDPSISDASPFFDIEPNLDDDDEADDEGPFEYDDLPENIGTLEMNISSTVQPPPVLQASRESRYETLPSYLLMRFPTQGSSLVVPTPWFRFNPEVDTLRFATWCRYHDVTARSPAAWVSGNLPPPCYCIEGPFKALTRETLPDSPSRPWVDNLAHLAFDASLFLRLADVNNTRTLFGMYEARVTFMRLADFLERSPSIRTCTIAFASAPLSHDAPIFPLPGDSSVVHSYNVRAVRIARKLPHTGSSEPRLREDGAVMIYHDQGRSAPRAQDLAIFELLDDRQGREFTRIPGGPTALARRMSWLLRAAPGSRAWLRILEPIDPHITLGHHFAGDMMILLTEWLLLEAYTTKRRLSAVCHGVCMPDYGF